jgi:hypothetical protein
VAAAAAVVVVVVAAVMLYTVLNFVCFKKIQKYVACP